MARSAYSAVRDSIVRYVDKHVQFMRRALDCQPAPLNCRCGGQTRSGTTLWCRPSGFITGRCNAAPTNGQNEKGRCINATQRPKTWCGEGDLNPTRLLPLAPQADFE